MKLFLNVPCGLHKLTTLHGMALCLLLAVFMSSCFMSPFTEAKSISVDQSGASSSDAPTDEGGQGKSRPKRVTDQQESDFDYHVPEDWLNHSPRTRNLDVYNRDLDTASGGGSVSATIPGNDLSENDPEGETDDEDKLPDYSQGLADELNNDTAVSVEPGDPFPAGEPLPKDTSQMIVSITDADTGAWSESAAKSGSKGGILVALFFLCVYIFWLAVMAMLVLCVSAYYAPPVKNQEGPKENNAMSLPPTERSSSAVEYTRDTSDDQENTDSLISVQ